MSSFLSRKLDILNFDGMAYRFIDTAGLRETKDKIEQMGVERSYDKINNASILLYVADGTNMHHAADLALAIKQAEQFNIPYLLILNKVDITNQMVIEEAAKQAQIIPISAKNGIGIESLKQAIANLYRLHFQFSPIAAKPYCTSFKLYRH